MPSHSTPTNIKNTNKIMTACEEPSDLSRPEGSTIKLGKTQEPIKWLRNQFNEIHGFSLDQKQSEPLPSKDKQSFVPSILKQIQLPV